MYHAMEIFINYSSTPTIYNTSQNFRNGTGRLLGRLLIILSCLATLGHPTLRQIEIYPEGLEVSINQLDFAIENLRRIPREDHLVNDYLPAENLPNTERKRYVAQQPTLPFPSSFQLTTLNGTNGFTIEGLNKYDLLGYSVAAGDINDDGFSDLVLGAYSASPPNISSAGTVYVLLGQERGWPNQFNLATLNGSNGFAIDGLNVEDELGYSVSSAGDINGDKLCDLLLAAYYASPFGFATAGSVYVLLGQASSWPSQFNLNNLNGSNGFAIPGLNGNDHLGYSVSTAGDINGDGLSDFVLGAYSASPAGRANAGTAYVLFGRKSGWPGQFNLNTLNGTNGFIIEGLNEFDFLGQSVSTAGDINGDGLSDVLLGAPGNSTKAGAVYVLLGRRSGWPSNFNLMMLNGTNGFALKSFNVGDSLGVSVSTAGDINGDLLSDIVLGASTSLTGTVYVLFGQMSGWPSQFKLNTLNGIEGFTINGVNEGTCLGLSVSTAGDVNGDGLTDVTLGGPFIGSSQGAVYVVFGQKIKNWPSPFDLTTLNGSNGFVINGINAGDELDEVNTAGDINGDGVDDLVLGASQSSPRGTNQAGTVYVIFGMKTSINAFSPIPTPAPIFNPTPLPLPSLNPMAGSQPAPAISPEPTPSPNPSTQMSNPTPLPLPSLNPIASQPAPAISPEPTPSPNPSTYNIPQNLTACPLNQSLQWLYHNIVIASAQALRLSPLDISVGCGNSSQPYLGAYFIVRSLHSATLQHRNATGGWNVGQLTFFGQDLARGEVALLQDGSAIAPELTITATDGDTTLANQTIQVQFILINSPPVLVSFHLVIPVDGRVTLTSDNIVLSSSTEKLPDLILSVTNVQNGNFVQIDAPDVPITEFTGYQVQTSQIQVVHTGGDTPIQFDIMVSDGLKTSHIQTEVVTLLQGTDPVTKTGTIVGGSVAGVIILVGCIAAIVYQYYVQQRRKKHLNELQGHIKEIQMEGE